MAGFCEIMREEQNFKNKEAMLDYLISLLNDSNTFHTPDRNAYDNKVKHFLKINKPQQPITSPSAYNESVSKHAC